MVVRNTWNGILGEFGCKRYFASVSQMCSSQETYRFHPWMYFWTRLPHIGGYSFANLCIDKSSFCWLTSLMWITTHLINVCRSPSANDRCLNWSNDKITLNSQTKMMFSLRTFRLPLPSECEHVPVVLFMRPAKCHRTGVSATNRDSQKRHQQQQRWKQNRWKKIPDEIAAI